MACEFRQRLDAYYDGELSEPDAAAVSAHLAQCPQCAAALCEMRELSAAFAPLAGASMSQIGTARAHRAADRAADSAEAGSIGTIAAVFGGLAASILIVGSVWLFETRDEPASLNGQPVVATAPRPAPEWERVAMTLDAGPLVDDDVPMLAEADLADWMVRNLNR